MLGHFIKMYDAPQPLKKATRYAFRVRGHNGSSKLRYKSEIAAIYEERKPPSARDVTVEHVLAVMDKKHKFDSQRESSLGLL
jgi:hypothetical protein